ncbi:hypothetical protein EVG20_g7168 [Dentipellis fragilis]|uniref:Uncharacterized protein n=1 Tax=Dentipellis fragilis TaxID=205917 RepID=A0A4Y9YGJ7_9AGAM|nr:hypothetical protein EVG20_g7168 [Dentipellis fragilis]
MKPRWPSAQRSAPPAVHEDKIVSACQALLDHLTSRDIRRKRDSTSHSHRQTHLDGPSAAVARTPNNHGYYTRLIPIQVETTSSTSSKYKCAEVDRSKRTSRAAQGTTRKTFGSWIACTSLVNACTTDDRCNMATVPGQAHRSFRPSSTASTASWPSGNYAPQSRGSVPRPTRVVAFAPRCFLALAHLHPPTLAPGPSTFAGSPPSPSPFPHIRACARPPSRAPSPSLIPAPSLSNPLRHAPAFVQSTRKRGREEREEDEEVRHSFVRHCPFLHVHVLAFSRPLSRPLAPAIASSSAPSSPPSKPCSPSYAHMPPPLAPASASAPMFPLPVPVPRPCAHLSLLAACLYEVISLVPQLDEHNISLC